MENLELRWGFHTLRVSQRFHEGEAVIEAKDGAGLEIDVYLNKSQVASLYKHIGQVMRNGGFGYLIDDNTQLFEKDSECEFLKSEITALRSQLEAKGETPEEHQENLRAGRMAIGLPAFDKWASVCGNCKHYDNGLCRGKYSDRFLTNVSTNDDCTAFYHKDND